MSATFAVRRGLPATFAVYGVQTLPALALSLWVEQNATIPLQAQLSARLDRVRVLDFLSRQAPGLADAATSTALLWVLPLLLLTPLLSLAWLHSLAGAPSLAEALSRASARYLPCAALSCALGGLALVPMAGLAFAAWPPTWGGYLGSPAARASLAALMGSCLWALHLAHDLGRARCLSHPAGASLSWALGRVIRPRLSARALAWHAAQLLWLAALATAARACAHAQLSLAVPLLLQLGQLGRLVLRSGWLARCLAEAT